MADQEDDSRAESDGSAADPDLGQPAGAHAIEPAVSGVPAGADEPTFRDRERMEAEGRDHLEPEDSTDERGDAELVTVGAGSKDVVVGASGERDLSTTGRTKKTKATARQKRAGAPDRRTGPVTFVRESVGELQKVVYPTGQQLMNYFVVVLIFVLFIIGIVSVLDLAFGAAILKLFG